MRFKLSLLVLFATGLLASFPSGAWAQNGKSLAKSGVIAPSSTKASGELLIVEGVIDSPAPILGFIVEGRIDDGIGVPEFSISTPSLAGGFTQQPPSASALGTKGHAPGNAGGNTQSGDPLVVEGRIEDPAPPRRPPSFRTS